jgi:hypothetical protein
MIRPRLALILCALALALTGCAQATSAPSAPTLGPDPFACLHRLEDRFQLGGATTPFQRHVVRTILLRIAAECRQGPPDKTIRRAVAEIGG